jgi:hypothetical protein
MATAASSSQDVDSEAEDHQGHEGGDGQDDNGEHDDRSP